MHDLRQKALLESGKTVSRKSRNRPEGKSARSSAVPSPAASPAPSRVGSKAPSRYASEAEDSEDEGSELMSPGASTVASSDDELSGSSDWESQLRELIEAITEHKRSAALVAPLKSYAYLLQKHYADDLLTNSFNNIITALTKSIRSGSSEEKLLATRAMKMTIVSSQPMGASVYEQIYSLQKGNCRDSDEETIKVESIQTLGIAAVFGEYSDEGADELLDFLMEIIESDGACVEAPDNGPVVEAALMTWGFVASQSDDLEAISEQAMEAFTEQLDSNDIDVQIAAGRNIGLVLEAERLHSEETGESWGLGANYKTLVDRITALARESSKTISKKNRKDLHANFNSLLTSIERGKGPAYSTAVRGNNPHTGGREENADEELGYREKLRMGNMAVTVDSWSLLARVEMLRSVIGAAMLEHFLRNPHVKDMLQDAHVDLIDTPNRKEKRSTPSRKKKAR